MEAPEGRALPTRETVLITLLGLAVLGVALTAGALRYTDQPSFCGSCHPMTTRYVSWQRSTHAERAACLDCHSEPGAAGEIKAHLDGARYLFVVLTTEGAGTIIRARVSNESCQRCHAAADLPDVVRQHRVAHRSHWRREISCADCHGNLVHGSLHGGAVRPSMATCIGCHTKTSPAVMAACATCHGTAPATLLAGAGRSPLLRQGGGP